MALLRKMVFGAVFAVTLAMPCALAWTAPAGAHPMVGIGANNVGVFSDPRFLALGVTNVRYDMAWDAMSVPGGRAALTQWLDDARADGDTPLITIDHSLRRGRARVLPSVAQYSRAFLAFRQAFPWVTQFATWDESNYFGQPISLHVRLAAAYYRALRRDCPQCTILGGELLVGSKQIATPMASYVREFDRYAHTQPAVWGVHDYPTEPDLTSSAVKQLLRATHAALWITETGVLLDFSHGKRHHFVFPGNARHSAQVMRYVLDDLGALSPRIRRVYTYEWKALTPHDSWDSALISYNDKPRPAYDVLASTLASWGLEPNCALLPAPSGCAATGTSGASGTTATASLKR